MTDDGYFQSEKMSLIQLYIPFESGHDCVSELGRLGLIEFRDLNPNRNPFQRAYTGMILRLDDMEKRVMFLIEQAKGLNLEIPETVLSEKSQYYQESIRSSKEMDEMESKLKVYEEQMKSMNESYLELERKYVELVELGYVVKYGHEFYHNMEQGIHSTLEIRGEDWAEPGKKHEEGVSLLEPGSSTSTAATFTQDLERGADHPTVSHFGASFGFVTGIVPKSKETLLESVLWRALRGNLYFVLREIEEEEILDLSESNVIVGKGGAREEPKKVRKTVFIASAHGHELLNKIRKLSEALGAHLYCIEEKTLENEDISSQIEDVKNILYSTQMAKSHALEGIRCSLNDWLWSIRKEKLVYRTLNQCSLDANRKCLIGEGWAPQQTLGQIQETLAGTANGAILNELVYDPQQQKKLVPPTYHPVNKFTSAMQEIVDAYGVGNYREINPGLFSLITFPFLFAVMFGDVGHGLMVAVVAGLLCIYEGRIHVWQKRTGGEEMFNMLHQARYILLLMGLFSIFMGAIYNDVLSKGMELFPSAYTFVANGTMASYNPSYTYPFGVDWAWIGAENALVFLNSYKMKQAVFLGVLHMLFGVALGGLNFYYAQDWIAFWSVFVPQMVFMLSIFGYLNFMIIFKWVTQTPRSGSLLTMLIQMFLSPGKVEEDVRFYPYQEYVQLLLVVIALLCLPTMLGLQPYLKNIERKKRQANSLALHLPITTTSSICKKSSSSTTPSSLTSDSASLASYNEEEEEDSFTNDLVHCAIHTIEYALGAVSNTASYLRLWALSLAHSQLSEVLWSMTVEKFGLSFILGVLIFPGWLLLTIAILILMEGLSAFLHALRLHWVEFNNKFYLGNGRKFAPFSYHSIGCPEE